MKPFNYAILIVAQLLIGVLFTSFVANKIYTVETRTYEDIQAVRDIEYQKHLSSITVSTINRDSLYIVYTKICNTLVPHRTEQLGKVRLLKVNGYYTDPNGNSVMDPKYKPIWYKIGTTKTTCEVNQKLIHRYVTTYVKKRIKSPADFELWLTENNYQ